MKIATCLGILGSALLLLGLTCSTFFPDAFAALGHLALKFFPGTDSPARALFSLPPYPGIRQTYLAAGYACVGSFFLLLHLTQTEARLKRAGLAGAIGLAAALIMSLVWFWLWKNYSGTEGAENYGSFQSLRLRLPETGAVSLLSENSRYLWSIYPAGLCGFFALLFFNRGQWQWHRLAPDMRIAMSAGAICAALLLLDGLFNFTWQFSLRMVQEHGYTHNIFILTGLPGLLDAASLLCFFILLRRRQSKTGGDDLSQIL
jgi:hypothetical protein